jgi:nicotinamide-nucleotide amidase
LDSIAARFNSFRAQMTENNKRQAYVPDEAIIIENPVGTAPGFAVEVGDRVVISLPGVPREMKFLMTEKIVPYLREKYQLQTMIIKARNFKTAGIGESALDELIGKDLLEASNPTIGLAAHAGVIDIRITAKAESEPAADAMIAEFETKVRERAGEYIFGADDDTIDGSLLEMLRKHGATLAVVEMGVESIVSQRLKSADPSLVKALNSFPTLEAGASALGIAADHPVRQIAEAAAAHAAEQAGATMGLAIISLSTGEEDRADTEELSATAVCYHDKTRSRSYGFGGKTETARVWTGTWAMAQAWRLLKDS